MINKFSGYKKQIRNNMFIYRFLGGKSLVMKYYKEKQGYEYDFNKPKLFTEKINSRKLEKNPLYTLCADKIKVRDYVKEKIGEEYLIPVYFTAPYLTKKLWDKMPSSCVLKTAGGSGTIEIIKNKDEVDYKYMRDLMIEYQKLKFHYIWGEMFYKGIKNDIICEKLLLDKDGKVPTDIKVHCFNNHGKKKYFIQLEFDRFGDHRRNIYDSNFKLLKLTTGLPNYKGYVEKPKNFDEIIHVCDKLSEDFKYVRVDLYDLDNKIYFGELTFTHNAGFTIFDPPKYNELWGKYWR